ncbi:hypothetical protein L218DRAFT_1007145 [Marasmius fiardii PR-910]|nr:hypothetical protein L218DRAFT_1007145 [Marasmius fiardii PR-910]
MSHTRVAICADYGYPEANRGPPFDANSCRPSHFRDEETLHNLAYSPPPLRLWTACTHVSPSKYVIYVLSVVQNTFHSLLYSFSGLKGGGLPEIDHDFALYALIEKATTGKDSKLHTKLANKIKNCLKSMEKTTNDITKALGETGAGIQNEQEIDMLQSNQFTDLWRLFWEKSLWYFDMRGLIDQHLSSNPVGIGNSHTGIDTSVIDGDDDLSSQGGAEAGDLVETQDSDTGCDAGFLEDGKLDEDEDIAKISSKSCPVTRSPSPSSQSDNNENSTALKMVPAPAKGKKQAKASTSAPTTISRYPSKKLTKKGLKEQFADIAKGEVLEHKELELATLQAKLSLKSVNGDAAVQLKKEEQKILEMKLKA